MSFKSAMKNTIKWIIISLIQLISIVLIVLFVMFITQTVGLEYLKERDTMIIFFSIFVFFILFFHLLYRFIKWKTKNEKNISLLKIVNLILLSPFFLIAYTMFYFWKILVLLFGKKKRKIRFKNKHFQSAYENIEELAEDIYWFYHA